MRNCLDLCPTLSALSDVGTSLTLTLLIGQLEIVVFIGDPVSADRVIPRKQPCA